MDASLSAPPPPLPTERARPVAGFLWGLAAWTGLFILTVAGAALAFRAQGRPVPWAMVLSTYGVAWYAAAALVPGWSALIRRVPPRATPPTVGVYVLATLVGAALWTTVTYNGLRLIVGPMRAGALFGHAILGLLFSAVTIVVLCALDLARRLRRREQFALGLRARLSEAELAVLKGQLQPHFLFNTLNGVASLIHTAPARADFVVVQLADLLRASLAHGQAPEIPLRDELALLEKYLAILAARFEGQVSVAREIAPGAEAALVPQFLLQPLVENAFEHGLARRGGTGRVWLQARPEEGDRLRLEVGDDGPGSAEGVEVAEGVGLGNTRRRLEHLYGARQSLRLSPRAGGGTLAVIEIPWHTT